MNPIATMLETDKVNIRLSFLVDHSLGSTRAPQALVVRADPKVNYYTSGSFELSYSDAMLFAASIVAAAEHIKREQEKS